MPTSKDHELRNVTGTCCDEIKAGRIEGYSRPNLKSTSGGRTMLGKAEHSFFSVQESTEEKQNLACLGYNTANPFPKEKTEYGNSDFQIVDHYLIFFSIFQKIQHSAGCMGTQQGLHAGLLIKKL